MKEAYQSVTPQVIESKRRRLDTAVTNLHKEMGPPANVVPTVAGAFAPNALQGFRSEPELCRQAKVGLRPPSLGSFRTCADLQSSLSAGSQSSLA